MTVHVPLAALPRVKNVGFEWLVPGLREELVTALVRALPKDVRRELVPIPDTVRTILGRMTPRSAPLPQALARRLNAFPGVQVTPAMLRLDALPSHLRMTFVVEDADGKAIATGRDLTALKDDLRPTLRQALEAATPTWSATG